VPIDLLAQLERDRKSLLDLTARNRLINTPLGRGRSSRLDVVDEKSADVFRILVNDKKEMSFLPVEETDDDSDDEVSTDLESSEVIDEDEPVLQQPEEADEEDTSRFTDSRLQTTLEDEKLQNKLLRLHYDAKSIIEEQGINSLFLALGFLEWYDSASSDKVRYAPLILLPVELHRKTVNAKFRIRVIEDEISTNLSLQQKMREDFGIEIPEVPTDLEDISVTDYLTQISDRVSDKDRWKVHFDRMTLWLFSFAKFRMFCDLSPESWPAGKGPTDNEIVGSLLGEPMEWEPPLFADDEPLDERLQPSDLCHVVDCDSSQAAAIEETRAGRNLVLQGPPGTGKSQSIANVIASAVRDGKSVLFVSEKMAALQVVKSRLDNIGVGDVCLELHSHKGNRRAILDDLGKTLSLRQPAVPNTNGQANNLSTSREHLNRYVSQLHDPLDHYELTPFQLIGKLAKLQAKHVSPLNFQVDGIREWTLSTLNEKKALLSDALKQSDGHENIEDSIWYGVCRSMPFQISDLNSFQTQLSTFLELSKQVADASSDMSRSLGIKPTNEESFRSILRLAKVVSQLWSMPNLDKNAFASDVWSTDREDIDQLIQQGKDLQKCRAELNEIFIEDAWNEDLSDVTNTIEELGDSFLRWFKGDWWKSQRKFKRLVHQKTSSKPSVQIELLKNLHSGQKLVNELSHGAALHDIGNAAFGSDWKGPESSWGTLETIAEWEETCKKAGMPTAFRKLIGQWENAEATKQANKRLNESFKRAWEQLQTIEKTIVLDAKKSFGCDNLADVPLPKLVQKVTAWRGNTEDLAAWIVLQRRLHQLKDAGLESLASELEQGRLSADVIDGLELMYYESAMKHALQNRSLLLDFSGITQDRIVEEFRRLDNERIRNTRYEVIQKHFQGIPKGGNAGEIGLIRGEIRKKRRHRTLRKLLREAGKAIQAIKPVFMMSPLSVAQYLEPGEIEFDLLVIDEASQVSPVQAIGAVARCNQIVVVGDNKQLPPTNFFDRIGDDDEEDDDEITAAGDMDSILDLCVARNMPQRMLRWHYRSRHQSLIAVSNNAFYDDKLFVVPSAERKAKNRGVSFHFVADGVFDRGKSRTNRPEAKIVAQAMIDHAKNFPKLSLGVGTFSVAQRDAIIDELELLRRANPETEAFFANSGSDGWFVKNLENIQGDERDTIFISVGYGPDKNKFVAMNFGPLTAKGGERRLNVLISRAKQRCVVFSSIRSDDIDLRRTNSRGVAVLKQYLQFAETGQLETNRSTGKDFDSEFEAQVADILTQNGWEVECQVGIAGFFIDLAVVDPKNPGRYLVGIECDGATYHSSRWARDRDRLRQAVLEDHGWNIYRIWSTDWFHSRDEQIQKLLAKVEDLSVVQPNEQDAPDTTVEFGNGDSSPNNPEESVSPEPTPDELSETLSETATGIPYRETELIDPLMSQDLLSLKPRELARIIFAIVEQESPIHKDEVIQRVRILWGLGRAGRQITNAVKSAIRSAKTKHNLSDMDNFLCLADQSSFPVRCRDDVQSRTLREAEMLPPMEIDTAINHFLDDHISAERSEIITNVAKAFGLKAGKRIRDVIEDRISTLINNQQIEENKNWISKR
jgi:very-short-patch-repair endonuclease